MANWCYNWVLVDGKKKNVDAFMDDIKILRDESVANNCGVRATEQDEKYMFDFDIEDYSFSFESKWDPVTTSLKFLAKKHNVHVTNSYEEPGCLIFGIYETDGESESDVCLDEHEYVEYNDLDTYTVGGKIFENHYEALEQALTNKIKQMNGTT